VRERAALLVAGGRVLWSAVEGFATGVLAAGRTP